MTRKHISADKSLRRQIETIKKRKLAEKKVVSLTDFRELQRAIDVKTILVVDDDEVMRNAFKRILKQEGYSIILAKDGLDLSKILETTRLDLILLDVNLPWVDGVELCRIIKGHYSLKAVPLVLVSGRKEEADIRRGFDAGCDDYVVKPFDIEHIIGVINKSLLKSG